MIDVTHLSESLCGPKDDQNMSNIDSHHLEEWIGILRVKDNILYTFTHAIVHLEE